MPKKRNVETKKLTARIEELEEESTNRLRCVDGIIRHIEGMLEQTHQEIAALSYVDDAQFAEAMVSLTAIKRTLSMLLLVTKTFRANWVNEVN